MGRLLALGYTFQIEIECYCRVGAKAQHQILPLGTMGPGSTPGIRFVHYEMRDLVRHSVPQIFLVVLGKYPWVVTYHATFAMDLEHARTAALQIEEDGHSLIAPVKNHFGLIDIALCRFCNLLFL